MDLVLNPEQRLLQEWIRGFTQSVEVRSWIRETRESKEFPREFMKRAGEIGLLGINVEEQYGGSGMSWLDALIIIEELAYASVSFSLNILVQNSLAGFAIETFGTQEQKEKFLSRMCRGELLGCFANTEPDAGSDAKNISLRAGRTKRSKECWLLNGKKRFITNASEAGVAVVFARTSERKAGHPGITSFLIEIGSDVRGFALDKKEDKIGQHGSTLCEFSLNDFVAYDEDILGEVEKGWEVCDRTFRHSRLWVAAQAIGVARRALDETVKHTSLRRTFGKPIIKNQAVAFELAKIKIGIESSRLLLCKAVCQEMAGDAEFLITSSMAKYAAGEVLRYALDRCFQYGGGMSYTTEFIASQLLLDGIVIPVYEGPSEIQLEIIAKSFFESSGTNRLS